MGRFIQRLMIGLMCFLPMHGAVYAEETNYVVDLIRYPLVEALLAAVIFVSLLAEIKTAGFSGGGLVAIVAGGILLGANWYVGLVHWYEFLLYFGGLALMFFDLFILLSGFGIVVGLLLMITGLYFTFGGDINALWVITTALILAAIGIYFLADYFPESRLWKKVALSSTLSTSKGYVSSVKDLSKYEGKEGVAVTVLRPVGKIKIEGTLIEATTEGDFIQPGTTVTVVRIEGNHVVVR